MVLHAGVRVEFQPPESLGNFYVDVMDGNYHGFPFETDTQALVLPACRENRNSWPSS